MIATFVEIQDQVMLLAGMSGTTDRDLVKDAINEAYDDMWTRHPWPFKVKEGWGATREPYSTGTVEATAADTLTLTGGTWPTDVVGMKVGIPGLTAPWYRVKTRTSGAIVVLDRNIPEYATAVPAGTAYYAYSDEVDISAITDIDTLLTKYVFLHSTTGLGTPLQYVTEDTVARWGFPRGAGRPDCWSDVLGDITQGERRLQIGPLVPDDVYQIHFYYMKTVTALSADADTSFLPVGMRHILVPGALRLIYRQDEFRDTNLAERAEAKYEQELKKAWRNRRTRTRVQYVRPFDYARRGYGLTFVIK